MVFRDSSLKPRVNRMDQAERVADHAEELIQGEWLADHFHLEGNKVTLSFLNFDDGGDADEDRYGPSFQVRP